MPEFIAWDGTLPGTTFEKLEAEEDRYTKTFRRELTMKTHSTDLARWRAMGTVTTTRYPRLHVWRQDRRTWRVLATDDTFDTDVTGPPYTSKLEAVVAVYQMDEAWFTPLPEKEQS